MEAERRHTKGRALAIAIAAVAAYLAACWAIFQPTGYDGITRGLDAEGVQVSADRLDSGSDLEYLRGGVYVRSSGPMASAVWTTWELRDPPGKRTLHAL